MLNSASIAPVRTNPSLARMHVVWKFMRRNPVAVVGLALVLVWVIPAIFAPWIAPYDPTAYKGEDKLLPPSATHLFGTDSFGRDVFSRIVYGGRITLSTGLVAVSISAVIGVAIGAIAGYYPGWRRTVITRLIDVLFAFPELILAMGIAAALGPGMVSTIIAVGLVGIPSFARIMYSLTLSLREREFIQAGVISGTSDFKMMSQHIFPNAAGPLLVQFTLSLGFATLTVAALSFIGLGTQPPDPEWGLMVSDGRNYILSGQWWLTAFAGGAIAMIVLGFNLLGDSLRDILDPRSR